MLRTSLILIALSTGAVAQTLPLNSTCQQATYAMDAYQAFGDLLTFGKRAEQYGENVPKEWQRPHGFFSAIYKGKTICEPVGEVTFIIEIGLRAGASYSGHPHIVIVDEQSRGLLDRWIWPDYSCNAFSYDMTRSLRSYEGALDLGKIDVTVVDLARRLSVEIEGCKSFDMKRQPWPYGDD